MEGNLDREAERKITQHFSLLSHEVRTPLTAIMGYADTLLEGIYGELNPEQHHAVSRIMRSGEFILTLTNSILTLASLGKKALHWEEVRIPDLVREVCEIIEPQVREKGLLLAVRLGDLPSLAGDGQLLKQVLINLLTNAVRFTDRGEIVIGAKKVKSVLNGIGANFVLLSVADTGVGVPREKQEQIFALYYQVDGTDRGRGGVGLGLAISQRIVELHGGRIWVESEVGQGSVFRFLLPVHNEQQEAPDVEVRRYSEREHL